jgi:RNA polymerase sigma factor (sigma-70 family)
MMPAMSAKPVDPRPVPEGRASGMGIGRVEFDAVVNAWWGPILRFFWRGVPLHEAEELAQRTFVSAYRASRGRAPRQDDQAGWRRYLFTCAKHVWVDHGRRRRAQMPMLDDVAPQEPVDGGASVLAGALRDEEVAGLRACLDGLEPEARLACLLHFFDGLSKREIGRLMRRPESTVRHVLVQALVWLRHCLSTKGLAPEPTPATGGSAREAP